MFTGSPPASGTVSHTEAVISKYRQRDSAFSAAGDNMNGQREEGMRQVLSCAASLWWSPEEETGASPAPRSGGSHIPPVSAQPPREVAQPDWGGEV